MTKKAKTLNWKSIHLEGAVLNDIEGLVGIEECSNYNPNAVSASRRSRKRKIVEKNHVPLVLIKKPKLEVPKKQKTDKKSKNRQNQAEQQPGGEFTPSKQGSTDLNISASTKANLDATDALPSEEKVFEGVEAWSNFGLPSSLLSAIKDQGFVEPTKIQALTLPAAVLGRRDILGAAETGSGKTLAFGLPILAGILKQKEKLQNVEMNEPEGPEDEEESEIDDEQGIDCVKVVDNIKLEGTARRKPLYALILTPTRELAIQVKNHLVAAAKYTGIKIAVVLGGMAVEKQERILSKAPEVVVATPGRLWELIQEGNSHLSQIDDIRFLAIDETDRMIERGHFKELYDILERVNTDEEKRKRRQNFVFSATLTLVHELPRHLAVKKKIRNAKKISKLTAEQKLEHIIKLLGITNPKIVDVTQTRGTAETLSECRITCAIDEKDFYVYYFLQRHPGRTLVFCNSIGCVKRLTTLLGLLGCTPLPLHASMPQRQRLKNLDRFRDNENGVLIATDVAARGLDIPSVEHVLHYQTPRTSESYVHRSGRTARASKQGITILFIEPGELQNYLRLCKTLGRTEDLPFFPVQESMLNAVKERVRLARELDKLDLQVRKAKSESGWLQKAAREMDILLDDNMANLGTSDETNFARKGAEARRKHLARLLSKPLFPRGFSSKYPLVSAELGYALKPIEEQHENAVAVLKSAVEGKPAVRNKAKWLFKTRKENNRSGGSKNNRKQSKVGGTKIKKKDRNAGRNKKQRK